MRRSGTYQPVPEGYDVFFPENLPLNPPINIDNEILDLLSKANRQQGRLDGLAETIPNPDLFVAMYVRQEAVLSSQIEGTQASLVDVLEYEAAEVNAGRVPDVIEVVNYITAMREGLEYTKENPFDVELIKSIHNILLEGTRGGDKMPGQYRSVQNWIGPKDCTIEDATFIPPPPNKIPELMGNFINYIEKDKTYPILMKSAIAHAQFETIHPFLDGNGRIGRLLITFLLCKEKALSEPLLYLSHYFKKYRSDYYNHLQNIRENDDWENWIKFFLDAVATVSEQAVNTARTILILRKEHLDLIQENTRGSAATFKFLDMLYYQPVVNVNQVSKKLEISYVAANRLVQKFVDLGLIEEITGQEKYRIFKYSDYLTLFPED